MNSNELFKTFIVTQHTTARAGFITGTEAHKAIEGYYKALEDMDGTDELTTLYKDLAGYVYRGTTTQADKARAILEGTTLSDLLDPLAIKEG